MNERLIIPILRIFDETKAKEFYIDFLGFTLDFEHRFEADFPIYMQVSCDAWCIHLSEHHGDCNPGAAIMLQMNDVKAYQELLREKKYKYAKLGCEETDWDTIENRVYSN